VVSWSFAVSSLFISVHFKAIVTALSQNLFSPGGIAAVTPRENVKRSDRSLITSSSMGTYLLVETGLKLRKKNTARTYFFLIKLRVVKIKCVLIILRIKFYYEIYVCIFDFLI
jgi:hypothetical protein